MLHRTLTGTLLAAAAMLCTVLVAACGSAAPAPGTTPGGTTVTVAYVPTPLFSPLFVAMSRGYFDQRGLKVELTRVASGQDAISLAASNKVQVVLGGFSAGLFNAVHAGLNIKIVGSMAGEPSGRAADGLVVSSALAATVHNPGDLKGRKVAVSGGPGATGGYLLAQALAPYHLTLSDVTPVNLALPEQASALRSGAVAAALMASPFLSDTVSSGAGTLIAQAAPGTSATGVIYSGAFTKSAAAQPFFDALARGAQDLQGAQATAPDNLRIEAAATGQSLDVLAREPASVYDPRLAPPIATLDSMQRVFLLGGLLNYPTPVPADQYTDGTFAAHVPLS